MTKINQEEYEILKELDDKWKWIARDKNKCLYAFTGKPVKKYGPLLYWGTQGFLSFELFDEKHLFQFIQWEDEEPYNIQELIEEYEDSKEYKDSLVIEYFMDKAKESEESEVLLQEENINIVLDDLKEHIKEQQSLSQNVGLAHTSAGNDTHYRQYDYVLECINEYEPSDDLQNLLVPKQKEVKRAQIPEWIIEWYQGANNEFSTLEDVFDNLSHDTGYSIIDSEKFRSRIMEYGGYSKMYEALSHIYFGVYEIEEEEQKYIVSDNSSIPLLIKDDSGKVMSYDSQIAYNNSNGTIELTEQEIKDYDERYMAFAKPVVVCN